MTLVMVRCGNHKRLRKMLHKVTLQRERTKPKPYEHMD